VLGGKEANNCQYKGGFANKTFTAEAAAAATATAAAATVAGLAVPALSLARLNK